MFCQHKDNRCDFQADIGSTNLFSHSIQFSSKFFPAILHKLIASSFDSPETDAPRLFSMRLDQCCCLLPLQELLLSQNGVLRVRSETWFPWITWISKLIWTFCPCTLVLPQTLQFYFQWCVHRSPSSLSDPVVLLGGPCLPTSLCI